MNGLPIPQIRTCEFEEILQPRVAAMQLDWSGHAAGEHRSWHLPGCLTLGGPTPGRFGIHIYRHAPDGYAVHLVWNQTHLVWRSLARRHLQESCLGALLAAMGTDLQEILDQPVAGAGE